MINILKLLNVQISKETDDKIIEGLRKAVEITTFEIIRFHDASLKYSLLKRDIVAGDYDNDEDVKKQKIEEYQKLAESIDYDV